VARLKSKFAPGKVPHDWAHLVQDDSRVTIVLTDVESSTALWEWDGVVMNRCIAMHDDLMRRTMLKFNGYEVTTEGDAFVVAFHTAEDSIHWAMHLQGMLMALSWPSRLATNPVTPTVTDRERYKIFNGLRVRVAMETGRPTCITFDQLTGRMLWDGAQGAGADEGSSLLRSQDRCLTAHALQARSSQWRRASRTWGRVGRPRSASSA